MNTAIILLKLTEQGAKAIKNAPQRIEKEIKIIEAMGGKIIGFYATLGEYDYVTIGQMPSDEVLMTYLLGLGSQGNVKSTTLKAATKEEFVALVKKLP